MKRNIISRVLAVVCAGVLVAAFFSGCATQTSTQTEQQSENRQYMSEVSQAVSSLAERLNSFEDAVSRGDVVTMRTQANDAFKVLDNLAQIEAPSQFEKVQQGYAEGCEDLKAALDAYVDLFVEIDSATQENPFDYATYDERIGAIQDRYDQGISKLEEADKQAVEIQE